MIMVQIRYDSDNRSFKILDHEVDPLFEEGDMYALGVTESGDPEVELIEFRASTVAHV